MEKNLEQFVGFLNDNANLILVLATTVYAFLTYRMVGLMKKQIVAHIRISKAVVKTNLLSPNRGSRDILLKEIVDNKASNFKNEFLAFRISIDIYNSSSGNGSIDQPKLILKFNKHKFELMLKNRNEESGSRETIFLRGGDFEKKDFDYLMPYNKTFFDLIKKCPGKLEYYIRYFDNLGKEHIIKADKVEPLS